MRIEVSSSSGGITASHQIQVLPDDFEPLPERPPGIESESYEFFDVWGADLQRMNQVEHQVQFRAHCLVVESQVLASGDVLNSESTAVSDRSARYQKYKGAGGFLNHGDGSGFYLRSLPDSDELTLQRISTHPRANGDRFIFPAHRSIPLSGK